jgi:predicted RNase H-like nuclease
MRAVGVDGCREAWVAVTLNDGRFERAVLVPSLADVLEGEPEATVMAVDIPIGLPEAGVRAADLEARRFVGPRWPSVFLTPPRAAVEAPTYLEAAAAARRLAGAGLSRQSYGLRRKILEADALVDGRIHEVHPEVTFRAIAGEPLAWAKKTAGGALLRLRLLEGVGISFPADLGPAAAVPLDDLLDAAAAAWSGHRIATGQAETLPAGVSAASRCGPAIWY